MEFPTVSIIIPSYNRANLLGETLNSVLSQTYRNWEAIIVDDGSTDGTQIVALDYCNRDRRIKFFERDREPKGANCCRNIGVKESQGEYIVFLDSDDLIAPFCLERRVNYFRNNFIFDFLVFPQLLFEKTMDEGEFLTNIETDEPVLNRFLRLDTVWLTTQPIWKRESIMRLNGFDEKLHCWQDLDLNLRAFSNGFNYKLFINDVEPDCYLRCHSSGRITTSSLNSTLHYESKMSVIAYAYEMVCKSDNSDLIKSLAVLLSSEINNVIELGAYQLAKNSIAYGKTRSLFTPFQIYIFKLCILLHQLRFNRIKGFYRIRNFLLGELTIKNRSWASTKYIPKKSAI